MRGCLSELYNVLKLDLDLLLELSLLRGLVVSSSNEDITLFLAHIHTRSEKKRPAFQWVAIQVVES